MPNPLLLDIALYLTSRGIVVGDGIDVFRDFTPESPDALVALHEYAGDPATPYDTNVHRSIQVSARHREADLARQKALAIFNSFIVPNEDRKVIFTPDRWAQVYLRQPPFKMGVDKNDRVTYGFNIGITTTTD